MAAEQYVRYDVRVEVRPSRSGGAVIDLGGGAPVRLTAASLREWRAGGPVPSPLWSTSPLSRRLARALADRPAGTLARIVLDLRGSEVIPLPWEAALPGSAPIVRASPARPRVLETPLTFPLRMLRLDPSESRTPTHDLDRTIRSIMPADSDDAAIVGRTEAARTGEFLTLWAWPSVEVIEVSAATLAPAGTSAAGAPRGLLSTAEPDRAGTLGWFERLAAGYQVRLLVVDCQTLREAADARLLAAALVARGGPAVVVADRAWPATLHAFYAQIIHDRPIDLACGTAGPGLGLTVGRHGEEALRISRVVGDLQALSRRLADPAGDPELRALRRTLEGAGRSADLDALAHTLPEFGYDTMRYDTESGGFVPLSRHLAWVRSVSGLGRVGLGGGVVDRPAAPATEARYLNIGLHTDEVRPGRSRPAAARSTPASPTCSASTSGRGTPTVRPRARWRWWRRCSRGSPDRTAPGRRSP